MAAQPDIEVAAVADLGHRRHQRWRMSEILHHTNVVRRLYRPDLPLLREHLIRLDQETRHDRYGHQVSDAYLGHYADECFAPGALTYGFIEDGVIRGAAELRMFGIKATREGETQGSETQGSETKGGEVGGGGAPAHREAEAAFSVERPWRRRGIGTNLMGHVVLAARNRRVTRLNIFCLRHNQAMLALARKFEADLAFEFDDITGRLVARPPSAMSLWREFVGTTLDLGTAMAEFQGRVFKTATHQGR